MSPAPVLPVYRMERKNDFQSIFTDKQFKKDVKKHEVPQLKMKQLFFDGGKHLKILIFFQKCFFSLNLVINWHYLCIKLAHSLTYICDWEQSLEIVIQ